MTNILIYSQVLIIILLVPYNFISSSININKIKCLDFISSM